MFVNCTQVTDLQPRRVVGLCLVLFVPRHRRVYPTVLGGQSSPLPSSLPLFSLIILYLPLFSPPNGFSLYS